MKPVKNNFQGTNHNNLTYFYYLGYINQKNIFENEILNTIAPTYSKLNYLHEIETKNINQELSYKIKGEIEQNYSASLLIKIVNEYENEKYERYYIILLHIFSIL